MLRDALGDPARQPELSRVLRAALLGPVLPLGAAMTCSSKVSGTGTTTDNKIPKWSTANSCTITDSIIAESGGKIGVGTTVPGAVLDVKSSGTSWTGGYRLTMSGSGNYWTLHEGNTEALHVTRNDGNIALTILAASSSVGVGTTSPTAKLAAKTPASFTLAAGQSVNVSNGSATVTGNSTNFLADLKVGDRILINVGGNQEGRRVISLASATSLTVDEAFIGSVSNAAMTVYPLGLEAIAAESNANSLFDLGDFIVSDQDNKPIRAASQLFPRPFVLGTNFKSAGMYVKIDPTQFSPPANYEQVFGIVADITGNQGDGEAGLPDINHRGHGDAIYVAVRGSEGVALEAATFVDNTASAGSKGIIPTLQVSNPNQYNTLFQALWGQSTEPAYGMYYAAGAPANALLIQKHTTAPDASTQIRLLENDLSRERFAVFNDGATLLSSLASSGTVRNSPVLRLRGTDLSADREIKLQNVVSGSNQYRLSIQDGSSNERMVVTQDGKVGNGTSSPGETLTVSGSARIAASGSSLGFFGASPQAKPTVTGSRGGSAALQSLLTALNQLGLIVDSSS